MDFAISLLGSLYSNFSKQGKENLKGKKEQKIDGMEINNAVMRTAK